MADNYKKLIDCLCMCYDIKPSEAKQALNACSLVRRYGLYLSLSDIAKNNESLTDSELLDKLLSYINEMLLIREEVGELPIIP